MGLCVSSKQSRANKNCHETDRQSIKCSHSSIFHNTATKKHLKETSVTVCHKYNEMIKASHKGFGFQGSSTPPMRAAMVLARDDR